MKYLAAIIALLASMSLFAQGDLARSDDIKVILTSTSLSQYGPQKPDNTFTEGDTVFINLEITGLQADEKNQMQIQADLIIPALSLDSKNIINTALEAENPMPMYFKIPIGTVHSGGYCRSEITIRDLVAQTYTTYIVNFKLRKP